MLNKIILAPMMDLTDRHCRFFLRQLSKHMQLYTEMITAKALIHGNTAQLLEYHTDEHPLCLQLGGSDPKELAQCAKWAEDLGYDEINLNVGCPSDRVQAGEFGLCLMKKPMLVAEIVTQIKASVKIPVSVKTRIGYDHVESHEHLHAFITQLVEAGVDQVSIHARKGWLHGLSPKENRTIPPLQYEMVYRLKKDFPNLPIAINGGIETLDAARIHLENVDGVMIGRAAYYDAYILAEVDQQFYGSTAPIPTREEILECMQPYYEAKMKKGVPLRSITRHMLGLYHGQPNAKAWRRKMTNQQMETP
ncbi:MAG: tRNA dihydrouridine(20/20a) synthase DusA [Gammaproteobacteria bacterium]|jgi:tRNA-dihydrouridine synthase A|nr:tRNA dihydrouridine(20/20a) synthase DusA [Gammaproteobacteria bacterium]